MSLRVNRFYTTADITIYHIQRLIGTGDRVSAPDAYAQACTRLAAAAGYRHMEVVPCKACSTLTRGRLIISSDFTVLVALVTSFLRCTPYITNHLVY